MRILLISLNRETDPYPVFPIGVWVLNAYLAAHGVEVDVADRLLRSDEQIERDFLARGGYDLVGISVRNVDNLAWPDVVSYLPELESVVAMTCRYVERDRIVLGGAGYSIFGQELLDRVGLRRGVAGDGERGLLALAAPGRERAAPTFSFAEAVPPEVLRDYDARAGMIGVQTRRGCPFDCSYCTYPQIEGRRVRTRAVAGLLAELASLRAAGIDTVYFVDCQFNTPAAYTRAALAALRDARLGVRWYAFCTPDPFDEEMAVLMKEAGCRGVEFGSESGDPHLLASLRKPFTRERIPAASAACRAAGLKCCHYLLLGAPGETPETVRTSIELLASCDPSTVIVTTGLRVYPGTGVADELLRSGRLPPGQSLLEPWFHRPEAIDLPELLRYCREQAPPHWVLPGVRDEERTRKTAFLREKGFKGPLWDLL